MSPESASLHADHVLEYTYTRSTGPIVGRYLAGLGQRRLLGIRSPSRGVICPPVEYDPDTAETLGPEALVDVGPEGEVLTWTWSTQPREGQPLDRPFAWALIRLDGADVGMLHAVDAGSEDRMRTGLRVRARWADETTGDVHDLACFEPVDGAAGGADRADGGA